MHPLPLRERMPLAYLAFTGAILGMAALILRDNFPLSMALRVVGLVSIVAAIVMALKTRRSW